MPSVLASSFPPRKRLAGPPGSGYLPGVVGHVRRSGIAVAITFGESRVRHGVGGDGGHWRIVTRLGWCAALEMGGFDRPRSPGRLTPVRSCSSPTQKFLRASWLPRVAVCGMDGAGGGRGD